MVPGHNGISQGLHQWDVLVAMVSLPEERSRSDGTSGQAVQ